jgi:hypothetical protein
VKSVKIDFDETQLDYPIHLIINNSIHFRDLHIIDGKRESRFKSLPWSVYDLVDVMTLRMSIEHRRELLKIRNDAWHHGVHVNMTASPGCFDENGDFLLSEEPGRAAAFLVYMLFAVMGTNGTDFEICHDSDDYARDAPVIMKRCCHYESERI